MFLTDPAVRNAKPKDKIYRLKDGEGLFLQIEPNNGKYWRLRYFFAGKEKMLALGKYPEVTLLDAREKRLAARKLVAAGIDPGAKKKEEKRLAIFNADNTFKAVAEDWHGRNKSKWTPDHAEILREELNRQFPDNDEKFEPKWKVRFKLVTTGTTILSQRAFNEWNSKIERVKFTVENKNAGKLIVDLYFPKAVHLSNLYEIARQEMYRVILALNIGTMSFYWWYNLQPYIKKYEYVEDVEKKMQIEMEVQNPYINVWKKNEPKRTMAADDVERLIWCFLMLPVVGENTSPRKFYGHYMQALVFYAKHEAELPMMINTGMSFLECLYEAMLFYNEIKDKKSFSTKFFEFFAQLIPDNDDQSLFRSIVEPFSVGNDQDAANKMTSDAATKMKIFCDAYLLQKFKAGLSDRMKQLTDGQSDEVKDSIPKALEEAAIP